MELLVTGGAGFIGSNFIRYVMRETDDVRITNLDLLTYSGRLENLRDLEDDPRYRFVHADIRDAEAVSKVMAGHSAVVNFAAESHVDRSIDGPGPFVETNVVGAANVFDAACRHGIPRCLHISTDEVYGSVHAPVSSREGDALAPNSPYSGSKAAADLLARTYLTTYDYPIMVTRTTNNFGPFHYPEKLIPLFVTNLIDGRTVPLYGDGSNVRDWLFVLDNVAAQWLVLTEGEPGEVYNVGAGNEMTNRHLTDALLERFGAGEERIEHVPDRPGHDLRYSVDTTRIRSLGWAPRWHFDAALDATIAWYQVRQDWWRPLRARGAARRRGAPLPTTHVPS